MEQKTEKLTRDEKKSCKREVSEGNNCYGAHELKKDSIMRPLRKPLRPAVKPPPVPSGPPKMENQLSLTSVLCEKMQQSSPSIPKYQNDMSNTEVIESTSEVTQRVTPDDQCRLSRDSTSFTTEDMDIFNNKTKNPILENESKGKSDNSKKNRRRSKSVGAPGFHDLKKIPPKPKVPMKPKFIDITKSQEVPVESQQKTVYPPGMRSEKPPVRKKPPHFAGFARNLQDSQTHVSKVTININSSPNKKAGSDIKRTSNIRQISGEWLQNQDGISKLETGDNIDICSYSESKPNTILRLLEDDLVQKMNVASVKNLSTVFVKEKELNKPKKMTSPKVNAFPARRSKMIAQKLKVFQGGFLEDSSSAYVTVATDDLVTHTSFRTTEVARLEEVRQGDFEGNCDTNSLTSNTSSKQCELNPGELNPDVSAVEKNDLGKIKIDDNSKPFDKFHPSMKDNTILKPKPRKKQKIKEDETAEPCVLLQKSVLFQGLGDHKSYGSERTVFKESKRNPSHSSNPDIFDDKTAYEVIHKESRSSSLSNIIIPVCSSPVIKTHINSEEIHIGNTTFYNSSANSSNSPSIGLETGNSSSENDESESGFYIVTSDTMALVSHGSFIDLNDETNVYDNVIPETHIYTDMEKNNGSIENDNPIFKEDPSQYEEIPCDYLDNNSGNNAAHSDQSGEEQIYINVGKSDEDQDIYAEIVLPDSPAPLGQLADQCDDSFDSDDEFEEELYSQLPTKEHQTSAEEGPNLSKHGKIVRELLHTEKAYVKRLHLLDQVFHFTVVLTNRSHNMFPEDVIPEIFSNIKSIYQFHHDFLLPQLETRWKNWESCQKVGDIMKKFAPFLKLYIEYVKNFDNAMQTISTWRERSQQFAELIDTLQKRPECDNLALQHHMLEPIQRVPRYQLLLQDYVKHLPDDSPDKEDAEGALQLVTKAASGSNEAMKKIEKFRKLLEINESLGGVIDLVDPTRELIKEGKISKVSARSGSQNDRYMFVFTDLILVCHPHLIGIKQSYRVKAKLDVEGMEVLEGDNLQLANTFYIKSKSKSIEFCTSTYEEKLEWMMVLNTLLADYTRKKLTRQSSLQLSQMFQNDLGKRAPIWVRDSDTSMCMECGVEFKMFRRRHHCRACGKVVCGPCSKNEIALAYDDSKLNRVCNGCFRKLSNESASKNNTPSLNVISPHRPKVLQIKANDESVLSDYLQISMDRKTWTKRWFAVHKDFVLYSFKAHQDVAATSSMPLPGYSVAVVGQEEGIVKPHVFKLFHKGLTHTGDQGKKIYYFQAEDNTRLNRWMSVLEKVIQLELPQDEND